MPPLLCHLPFWHPLREPINSCDHCFLCHCPQSHTWRRMRHGQHRNMQPLRSCPLHQSLPARQLGTSPSSTIIFDAILDRCADETSQSHLLGAATSESGAWLNAPPVHVPSLGLYMSNEDVCIAMGLRVGAPLCLPHNCNCGEHIDATGHHGLSCRTSQGSILRHQMLNTIIQRYLASANICSRLGPSGLY